MAGAASEIVAVDSSVKMLEVLRAKGARHGWTTVRPTTQIPMAGDGFDLIVCSSVCSFLDDYPAVARQLASLLRPGGLFVQWDWERDEGDPDGHGLTGNEIIDALTSAELEDVSVLIGFEVSFGDQIMRPLMGHGRRSVA
jgi:ubiquinone/menaquinone biosynthesis C-methylase UbiE